MAEAALTVHMPGSHRVTLDQLRELPVPEAMGRLHKPIHHAILVDTILDQIADRGWSVTKQQFAVARKGQMLFGTMDLRGPAGSQVDDDDGTSAAFGFRSSTGQQLALRGVAGQRVWLCDNMCMSGSEFVMRHKLTTRLNLPLLVSQALNKFIEQTTELLVDLTRLRATTIGDREAKVRIFDIFNKGALPLHMFDDVSQLYFHPQDEHPDCQPRSLWGLHNACTRAVKLLSPARQFTSGIDVSRIFNMADKAGIYEVDQSQPQAYVTPPQPAWGGVKL
jgi:hypothetical protein